MRKTLRLALAVAALCLPATAAASTPLQIRHVDVSGFPLVRVTAAVSYTHLTLPTNREV